MWELLADKICKSGKNAILFLGRRHSQMVDEINDILYSEIYCIEGESLDNRELFSCWRRAVLLQ